MRKGLVNPSWLSSQLSKPSQKLSILDASWYLPTVNRSAIEEYKHRRIQGAKFFDLDNHFSDKKSPYPHMLPDKTTFWRHASQLGIEKGDFIVAYDGMGIFSSARCWWMFLAMGWDENRMAVLDGGFNKFASKYPDLIDQTKLSTISYKEPNDSLIDIEPRKDLVRTIQQIENNLDEPKEIVVDARPKGRFDGIDPEPRPGISSGHIPKSVSLPYVDVLEDGCMKEPSEITRLFSYHEVDLSNDNRKPIVFSCGSGVSAAVLYLSAASVGTSRPLALYDGSWAEYADTSKVQRPINSKSSYEEDQETKFDDA